MNIRQQFGPLDASPQPNQTVQKHKKNSAEDASRHSGFGSTCMLVDDLILELFPKKSYGSSTLPPRKISFALLDFSLPSLPTIPIQLTK